MAIFLSTYSSTESVLGKRNSVLCRALHDCGARLLFRTNPPLRSVRAKKPKPSSVCLKYQLNSTLGCVSWVIGSSNSVLYDVAGYGFCCKRLSPCRRDSKLKDLSPANAGELRLRVCGIVTNSKKRSYCGILDLLNATSKKSKVCLSVSEVLLQFTFITVLLLHTYYATKTNRKAKRHLSTQI